MRPVEGWGRAATHIRRRTNRNKRQANGCDCRAECPCQGTGRSLSTHPQASDFIPEAAWQLTIALRRAPPRLRLRGSDRALLVWMTRLWPGVCTEKSDSAIMVMKAAEDGRRYDAAHVLDGDRSVLVERPMSPQLIIISGILRQYPAQVRFA